MADYNQNSEPSSRKWTVLTDFTNDVDLTAHAEGDKQPARALDIISGGVVAVTKPNGTNETSPSLPVAYQMKGQVSKILKASSGTTATAVIVYW